MNCYCLKVWTKHDNECRLMASLQVALTLGHHTLVYSIVPSNQPVSVDKFCQSLDMQAGGWAGEHSRQADSAVWHRRGSETDGWAMFDDSPSSSINRHLSKSSRLFGDATDTTLLTSALTNRRGCWEMATHLFMVWCPQSGQSL